METESLAFCPSKSVLLLPITCHYGILIIVLRLKLYCNYCKRPGLFVMRNAPRLLFQRHLEKQPAEKRKKKLVLLQ